MIKNERQYRITKYQAERFVEALAELKKLEEEGKRNHIHPVVRKAERDGLESQLADLNREIQEYEQLKNNPPSIFDLDSIEELPKILIKARIALKLNQKDLAERIGVPEQVIQRYEATDYESASVARVREIIDALKIVVGENVRIPDTKISVSDFFRKMSKVGLDRKFVEEHLLPMSLTARLQDQETTSDLLGFQAAAHIGKIYGWKPDQVFSPEPLTINPELLGGVRFKVSSRVNQPKLKAYTVYARYISLLMTQATERLPRKILLTNPFGVRKEILSKFSSITLESLVRYIWEQGVPVIALDVSSFHAACLHNNDRNVIMLAQKTSSEARWMFNLMHEFYHAAKNEERVEESEEQLRGSDEEIIASQFADVVLTGKNPNQLHELATRCLDEANWDEYLLKSIVQKVADREGVRVDVLANYLAYRLSTEKKTNWWGTAESLQKSKRNVQEMIRNIMLEYADFGVLAEPDLELLRRAVSFREVAING